MNENFDVSSWREVLKTVMEELNKEVNDFPKVTEIRGRERKYFSKNSEDLVQAVNIPGSPTIVKEM